MRKSEDNAERSIDIVGMIDMIFILLIFFLVTMAAQTTANVGRTDIDLPELAGKDVGDRMTNLGIRFERTEEADPGRRPDVCYIITPGPEGVGGSFEQRLAIARGNEADAIPLEGEPEEIEAEIRERLLQAIEDPRNIGGSVRLVEISAITGTEFYLIDTVLKVCADEDVPAVSFRTKHR